MSRATEADLEHLRAAIALTREAAARGDNPFGARLVDAAGTVLAEATNRVHSTGDCTAHAELLVVREVTPRVSPARLAGATLYASAEPCAMCAGAICWSGIGRVVYGASTERIRAVAGPVPLEPGVRGGDVLRSAPLAREVLGPVLEAEALAPFERRDQAPPSL